MAIAQGLREVVSRLISGDKDAESRTQAADDFATIDELENLFKQARDDRRQREGEWLENLAFLRGQQWLQWSKQRQALYLPPAPPWRRRVTTNYIQPVFRTLIGKIAAQPVQGKALATGREISAVENARAQDELLDWLSRKLKLTDVDLEVLEWAALCGSGFYHPCWDKGAGDETVYPDSVNALDPMTRETIAQSHPMAGQPVREPNPETGEDDGSGPVVRMGELDVIAVSPFQFFPEPLAKKLSDMEWAFYVSVRPASYVERKYGVKLEEETISADDHLQFTATGEPGEGTLTKGVVVYEFWRRAGDEKPDGQHTVYAQKKVLRTGANPYPTAPLPFEQVRDPLIPGDFWGRSVVSDLVPIQRAHNRLKSLADEIRLGTARPKWHAFKNSLDAGQTISTAPNEILVTNVVGGVLDGGRPTKIGGGDVPASFDSEATRLEQQFYEIAGVHDFRRDTQGFQGGKTYHGLALLLEQDDTRMGLLRREYEKASLAVDAMLLRLAKQFYIEPRAVEVVGADHAAEVHEFYAERIADDPQVVLVASGNMPTSAAMRAQYVFDLMEKGVVTDLRSVRKLLGLAEIPGITDDLDLDTRQAERENKAMRDGQDVPAHDYDDHLIHGQEHDDYRKSEEYEQRVAQDPGIAERFARHIILHRQLVQAMLPQSVPVAPLRSGTPAPPKGVAPPALAL